MIWLKIILPDRLLHEKNLTIILNDLNGKQIRCLYLVDHEKLVLDLKDVPQGYYIVSLLNSNGRYMQKLIVN